LLKTGGAVSESIHEGCEPTDVSNAAISTQEVLYSSSAVQVTDFRVYDTHSGYSHRLISIIEDSCYLGIQAIREDSFPSHFDECSVLCPLFYGISRTSFWSGHIV
jgi:hypothetical protein